MLFAKAMALAGDDVVRRRVEKASLTLRRVEIEPVVAWIRQHPSQVLPEDLRVFRPRVRRFFALCRDHGVTEISERFKLADAEARFRAAFGLAEGEAW